ncbi:hypothetical protein ACFQ2K_51915 [Streptomyces sanglieri]|uniref:Uncharacterized protein n=1 Tax=Streptomyces sanglieri TaxID=193460 RepID=A0ABW2X960_9ACTN
MVNVLLSAYTTMGAVRHGDYIAKVRIAPDPGCAAAVVGRRMDVTSADEVFRPALVSELRERPYAFDIQVQLCADLERMPVEDLTVEWPEHLSPYVTVARLRFPSRTSPERTTSGGWMPCPSLLGGCRTRTGRWAASCGPARRSTATPPSCATGSTSKNGVSPAARTRCCR